MFSRFFIDRPIFAAVLSIVIFAAGLISIPLLPIGEYPEVVPPSVVVRTVYPGANPKVISETVATPLEEAITGVEDMMYVKSVAGSDGVVASSIWTIPLAAAWAIHASAALISASSELAPEPAGRPHVHEPGLDIALHPARALPDPVAEPRVGLLERRRVDDRGAVPGAALAWL